MKHFHPDGLYVYNVIYRMGKRQPSKQAGSSKKSLNTQGKTVRKFVTENYSKAFMRPAYKFDLFSI